MNPLLILAFWGIGLCPPDFAPELACPGHSAGEAIKQYEHDNNDGWWVDRRDAERAALDSGNQQESSSKDQGGHE